MSRDMLPLGGSSRRGVLLGFLVAAAAGCASPAESACDAANVRLNQKDYDGALRELERALEQDPGCARAYLGRGLVKQAKGDAAGAIADLTRAIELDPQRATAFYQRGGAKAELKDYEGAIVDYTRATEIDPKFILAYLHRGQAKRARGEIEGALADYSQALSLDPQFAPAHYAHGNAMVDQKNFDRAITDYTRTIELDPKLAVAYYGRAYAKHEEGDLEGAIADFSKALELAPKYVDAFYARGNAKSEQKQYDAAREDYSHALELSPRFGDAYYGRAYAAHSKGESESSIPDYTKAIELGTKHTSVALAYANRAYARLSTKDVDGAIADSTEAIKLDPKLSMAYVGRCQAKSAKGDLDGALADANRAIELGTKDEEVYSARAQVKKAKGDLAGALADATEAIRLDPKNPEHYSSRAALWWEKAQSGPGSPELDHVLDDCTKAIDLDPRSMLPYLLRALARTMRLELDEAERDCDQAIECCDPNAPCRLLAIAFRNVIRALQGRQELTPEDLDRAFQKLPEGERSSMAGLSKSLGSLLLQFREYAPEATLEGLKRSQGSLEGVLAHLDQKLAGSPKNAVWLVARGMGRAENKDLPGAVQDFGAAIASDPAFVRAFVERAKSYQAEGNAAAARRDWDQAIRLGTRTASVYNERGWASLMEGENDESFSDFQKALELESQHKGTRAYSLKGCALVHYRKHDYDTAIAELTQALGLEPRDAWSHAWRGAARLQKGETQAALEDADRSLEADPEGLEARLVRGAARKERGDVAGAIKAYEEILPRTAPNWRWRLFVEASLSEWRRLAGPKLSPPEAIAQEIRNLSSGPLAERRRAARNLSRSGSAAIPLLRQALSTATGEPAEVMAAVLLKLEAPREAIAARVNGEPLLWSQVNDSLSGVKPAERTPKLQAATRKELVEGLLLNQLADRKQIEFTDAQLEEVEVSDRKFYGTPEEFEKVIRIRYGTLAKYRDARLQDLTLVSLDRLVLNSFVPEPELKGLVLSATVPITEIQRYFDSHRTQFESREQVAFVRIGLSFATPEEEAAKRELAESLLRKLRKGSEFTMLAYFYSTVTRAKSFRDRGVTRGDLDGYYTPETIRYLFEVLKPGELSPIVKDGRSLNIFKMEQKLTQMSESFEEAQAKIRGMLETQRKGDYRRQLIDALRQHARIEPADVFGEDK